jgi:dihydrofolate reductase
VSLPLVLVAAVARNGVIGRNGALPWRLPGDLKHFRAVTWGRPMIMGRKTWESIGRPLPGRRSIVVTRDYGFAAPGAEIAPDIDAALALAGRIASDMGAPDIAVIGGGEIYRATIDRAARLAITEVDLAPDGDAVFPRIDPALWRETAREPHPPGPGDEAACAFVDYERVDCSARQKTVAGR